MSASDREKVRRRRSRRLSRQYITLNVPVVTGTETSDCPVEDGVNSVGMTCPNSSVYSIGQDLDTNGGSFWEEVDAKKIRTRRSRRTNNRFHVAKAEYTTHDNFTDADDQSDAGVANPKEECKAPEHLSESPEIEVLRCPCPEVSPYIKTPTSYLTESNNLEISQTKTPSVANDKSLAYIQTPSSATAAQGNGLGTDREFDDAFMLGMDTPGNSQCPNVSCPPSCEDDSEDSLLICTPDLSKFKKNIRFRCSLDFTEFDQTPSKGDNPAENSQDSIHESPIVGYVYDKLNATDLMRKRRSTSLRSGNISSQEQPTPKNLNETKHLKPAGNEIKEEKELPNKSSHDSMKGFVEKPAKSLNVSVQSSSSSQSMPSTASPSSGMYTSCVEEDFLSVPSAQPSQLNSPVLTLSPEISQTGQSTPLIPTHEVEPADQSTPISGSPNLGDKCLEWKVNNKTVEEADQVLHSDKDDTNKCVDGENMSNQSQNNESISSGGSSEKKSTQECESKTKERNIASDVCDMFRSLARKFSGGKKKKRRSGSLKNMNELPRLVDSEGTGSLLGDSESPIGGVDATNSIFSFRKEPKLPKLSTEESVKTSVDTTPKGAETSLVLDFSPFLPPAENNCNINISPKAQSPVWKLQCDQNRLVDEDRDSKAPCEIVSATTDETETPTTETVLQEKSTNIECDEPGDKPVMKKRSRPKRRSIEASVLQQECREFQATEQIPAEEEEDNKSVRRSRRTRRSSLEMFRYQSQTSPDWEESPESMVSPDSDTDSETKKPRSRKKARPRIPEVNLEDLYQNKNYTLPTERMWETVFESPEKSKQPNLLQSKRKYRRTITFDTIPPAKIRKRLQRAVTQGWDVTGKKRTQIPIEEVKNKIALLAAEID